MEKNLINAFTTELDVILRNGTASGKRVAAHIMVSKYHYHLVRGKGPTQSTITRSNGSPIAGIGCSGAGERT